MAICFPSRRCIASLLLLVLTGGQASARSDSRRWFIQSETAVAAGWHPWYQIKSDPEDDNTLLLCGMEWSSEENAFHTAVYRSKNGGKDWALVLQDKSSPWVSEPSCTFGPHHRAYLISEASSVEDGELHHYLGTSRLFVSVDAGKTWNESLKTGWADYSSSVVGEETGSLYTFYQADASRGQENHARVGVLVFSADGKTVSGPYFSSEMKATGYAGVYPSNATALRDGSVISLFLGNKKRNQGGWVQELGLERVEPHSPRQPNSVIIAKSSDWASTCRIALQQYSLAYDREHNRIYVLYVRNTAGKTGLFLTSSDDGGRTWSRHRNIRYLEQVKSEFHRPSLAKLPGGGLGLIWQDSGFTGAWRFSTIEDGTLHEPSLELSPSQTHIFVSNDSLLTAIQQARRSGQPTILVNVRSEWNRIGVAQGLISSGRDLKAVWLSGNETGLTLHSAVLSNSPAESQPRTAARDHQVLDVTDDVSLFYDGKQSYDETSHTLCVDVRLKNRGIKPLRVPIELDLRRVSSSLGTVRVLSVHATDSTSALFDVTRSITGGEIAPGASSDTIRLSFRIEPQGEDTQWDGEDLLSMSIRVYAVLGD